MNFRKISTIFISTFAFLFCFTSAQAQGVIVPIICEIRRCPPPRPIPRPIPVPNVLPVKSINLDTKINGQVATTHVEQIFLNRTPYTLEGTYFFPIPETASIVEFAIWENGKKLVGEVRSREEARRIYDEIVRRQRDPGLLEYAGKDLFQASIFPIPPNSEKKLELTYTQILKAESGTVSYKYPLGTGGRNIVVPQTIPMMEGDQRVGVGRRPEKIGTVSGRIEIAAPQALRNIYSPSHSIDVKHNGETKAVLTFESTAQEQRDFQLFYGLSNNDFGLSLLTYREAGKDGYFLLILSPKDKVLESEIAQKDLVFVLDTSGSMADEGKMEKARAALLFGIKSLREGDRFNVINFAGEEHLMESGLIAANADGKKRGEEYVKKLSPTGGTNINDALRAALRQFDSSDRPKLLVFMTDGLPTVGEQNVERIIKNAKEIRVEGLRLFTFGVGYDVNTNLLDQLANANDGTSDYVEPKEDLEIKVSNFFTKVSSPVLTNVSIDFAEAQTDYIYPRKFADLFRGSQVTMMGRYKNHNDLKNVLIRVSGKTGKEARTFSYPNLDFPLRDEENTWLPRLWATRRVGWLIDSIRANGETKEVRDEIVELGTRYGIVTPYTSYLATDGSERRDGIQLDGARGNAQRIQRAAPGALSSVVDVTADSGRGAVSVAKESRKKREAEQVLDHKLSTGVRSVGNKTFIYDENGVWTDTEFKAEAKLPEVNLKFASDEFFKLIANEKELAQYFALGEEVIVVWKGKVYRVKR